MTDWLTITAAAIALLFSSGCAASIEPVVYATTQPATQPTTRPLREYQMPLLPPGYAPWPDGWPGQSWMFNYDLWLAERSCRP